MFRLDLKIHFDHVISPLREILLGFLSLLKGILLVPQLLLGIAYNNRYKKPWTRLKKLLFTPLVFFILLGLAGIFHVFYYFFLLKPYNWLIGVLKFTSLGGIMNSSSSSS